MNIQCISQRPNHNDNIYGTGAWSQDEVKDVPDDLAKRLLNHRDVYVRPVDDVTGEIKKVVIAAPVTNDEQPLYDELELMSREQLRDFITNKFNQRVDMRMFKTVDSIRAHAKMLVGQYGAPA